MSAIQSPAQTAAAASVHGLVKDFPAGETNVRVLHGIDLSIETGSLTMLVGPSGCGKTTLISIMTGILSATAGHAEVLGVNITAMKDADKVPFRRRHLGFIFQQYNLLPALTAAENAAIPLIADRRGWTRAVRDAGEMLAQLGMKDHVNKLPNQLSGGQQQRVAIARALVHEPGVIVCDEPTAALDAESGRTVMELLSARAKDASRAVVVVTHDDRIFSFADRIVSMSDGRIVSSDQTQSTRTHHG
jgi:putative ABC transport system ATP-binding protein